MFNYNFSYKIIMIGNMKVGKSSILKRYLNNTFHDIVDSTIGIDYGTKILKNKNVKIIILDTCENERFISITRSYYKTSTVILIIYSINSIDSISNIKSYLNEINNYGSYNCKPIIYLIGNKIDLNKDGKYDDVVSKATIIAKNNNLHHILVSAKEDINIDNLFYDTYYKVFDKWISKNISTDINDENINNNDNCCSIF